MSQVIAHNAKVNTVEGMGSVTEAYTERVLELGTHTYSETTTMAFDDGTSTVYVVDLIQLRTSWTLASVCDDGLTGEHTEEYLTVDEETAQAFIRTRRQMHGLTAA